MKLNVKIALALLLVIAVAYIKNTWVLNPFNANYAFFIPRFHNQEVLKIGQPNLENAMASNVRLLSVGLYHMLFFLLYVTLFWFLFKNIKFHLYGYFGISVLILLLWLLQYFSGHYRFYTMAMYLKDFLQGPVYFVILGIILYSKNKLN